MKTKVLKLLLVFGLLSSLSANSLFAAESQSVSEQVLNDFVISTGFPEEKVNELSYGMKLNLYQESLEGRSFSFVTDSTQEFYLDAEGYLKNLSDYESEIASPMATIPATELQAKHIIFDVKGTSYKRIYADFYWAKPRTTKGDKIGIALPTGWEIKAQSYGCVESQSGNGGIDWSVKGNCDGGTYDLNFYGAAWSLTRTADVWHHGSVWLEAKKTSSSAQNKVIGSYADYKSGNAASIGVSWGPLSISFTGNGATIDKRAWDTSF